VRCPRLRDSRCRSGHPATCRCSKNGPSKLARLFFQEEAWLILYCARRTRSFRLLILSLRGSGRGCPLLRASNEHILIVRVLRARRAPGHSLSSFRFRAPRKGWRGRRRSERPHTSFFLIAEVQTDRMICTAESLSILPTDDTFPSCSFRTIRSIWTIAPRCQSSTAAF
jgi:hypothetical protein